MNEQASSREPKSLGGFIFETVEWRVSWPSPEGKGYAESLAEG
jgi:hypothetical protein